MARSAVLALATLLLSGCLATRNDMRVLQSDLLVMRQEAARADADRKAQMDRHIDRLSGLIREVTDSVRVAQDSILSLGVRVRSWQGSQSQAMREIQLELVRLAENLGQSQKRLQEMRAAIERNRETNTPPASAAVGDTSATGGPGPYQLYQAGLSMRRGGSHATARTNFQELIDRFPESELASVSQLYIGETYASQRDSAAADSVYAIVAERHPTSAAAPTALYRRGVYHARQGKTAEARTFFQTVVSKYPQSNEAGLAKERLAELKG